MDKLDFIFNPKSVAVVGASAQVNKYGYIMIKMLTDGGYRGRIFPINPRGGEILGWKVYPSLVDIEDPIDVAICSLPPKSIKSVLLDCVKKRVGCLIVFTVGFGELSEEGAKLEQELVEIAREGGTRIIGPNCMGILSHSANLNLTAVAPPPAGELAFVAQSGNLAMGMFHEATIKKIGISKYISVGNQIDIQFHEYLSYLKDDPSTKVIMMYLEGVKDGAAFLEVAKETIKVKPIIIYKAGVTQAGARSAFSHTASLTGADEVYDGFFKQIGLIRLYNWDEMLDIANTLANSPIIDNKRIALIGGGGGHATTLADAVERHGLEVPVLSERAQARLGKILLERSVVKNPIDFVGASEELGFSIHEKCLEICFDDDAVDGVIFYGLFGGYRLDLVTPENSFENSASEVIKLVEKYNKPVIVHTPWGRDELKSLDMLREAGISVYDSVDLSAKCMSLLFKYGRLRQRAIDVEKEEKGLRAAMYQSDEVANRNSKQAAGFVSKSDAMALLSRYNFPLCPMIFSSDEGQAVDVARKIGFPVVLKIASPDILHKTEFGGVKLNLKNDSEVREAYEEIIQNVRKSNKEAKVLGCTVSPYLANDNVEVIVGFSRDKALGPVIMFGLGGVFVEVLKDVSFRVAPLARRDAYEMIQETKGYEILRGTRGQRPKDIESIVEIILKTGALALENPDVKELDLNPVLVSSEGSQVVDVRIIN
jgi:acyl-CoA synthetase (NDP forming)